MANNISLCMIAKNEAANIKRSLSSVINCVDEVILVDTGSTDNTPKIAKTFNANIFSIPWPNDFSAARNIALQKANCDWILVLDADEELEPLTQNKMHKLVESNEADAFQMIQRNFQPPGEIIPYTDFFITRLFRRQPDYYYEGIIHEQITPSIQRSGGKVEKTDLVILHYGYLSKTTQSGESRAERNLSLLTEALTIDPDDAYLLFQTGITLKSLSRMDEAEKFLLQALSLKSCLSVEILEQTHMKLAQIYLSKHEDASALQQAELCLNINPSNSPALYIAGLTLFASGKPFDAYSYFNKVSVLPNICDAEKRDVLEAMFLIERNYLNSSSN